MSFITWLGDKLFGGLVIHVPTLSEPSPCGRDADHAYWKHEGWACPHCSAIRQAKKRAADELRMATLIAEQVVKQLNNQSK